MWSSIGLSDMQKIAVKHFSDVFLPSWIDGILNKVILAALSLKLGSTVITGTFFIIGFHNKANVELNSANIFPNLKPKNISHAQTLQMSLMSQTGLDNLS